MKKKIFVLSVATALIILNGCGGGAPKESTAQLPEKTGNVADGYIEGAYVCHDSDADMDCLDETYATTATDGSFTLSNYDNTQNLLVQIPIGAVDKGPFSDGSTTPRPFTVQTWYYYPAGAAPQNGPIFVGPLSTLVFAQMESVPGISVDDAIGIIGTTIGVDSEEVLSNYLENNSSEGNYTQFVAEIVGTSVTTTASNSTNYDSDIQNVLDDLPNVAQTATDSNSLTYDTTSYENSTATQSSAVLPYIAAHDICTDLSTSKYFAFEEWDDVSPDNEHKTLYMTTDASTGNQYLNIKEEVSQGSAWSISTYATSTEDDYLKKEIESLIDMSNVNSTTVSYMSAFRLFPAKKLSCSGSSATFKTGAFEYKIVVSEAGINGLAGSVLPKGPSVNSIIDNIIFGAGDKIYKTILVAQNKAYHVKNRYNFFSNQQVAGSESRYIVYEEGTIGGSPFATMANSNNINAMAQLTDTDFIVDYENSSNFTKLSVSSPVSSANNGTVTVEKISDATSFSSTTMTYEIEIHNNTPFFIVKNFEGIGQDLFLGKISAVDANNFVYGYISPPYASFDITEGGFQNGDIMDDIMLNTSARDRVLNAISLTAP